MRTKRKITNEHVLMGHPDKVSDQISDAILDHILSMDGNAKVAVEVMVKDNAVILGGEVATSARGIDYDKVVRETVKGIGYTDSLRIFSYANLTIINLIGEQSTEISNAVGSGVSTGAGDQGFMVGFATNETPNRMPIGVYVARMIGDGITSTGFGPDGKVQVTVEMVDDVVERIDTIVVSVVHSIPVDDMSDVIKRMIKRNYMGLEDKIHRLIDEETKIMVNPAGAWHIGGPASDCGLTGRKIVIDQYGPYCPIGGGAFSGKDGTKVDRSGAYLCRYIANNVVASGLADKCQVEIGYIIGLRDPISFNLNTFGGFHNDELLSDIIRTYMGMDPFSLMVKFNLRSPIFLDLAKNGHFGRGELPWEKTDFSDKLRNDLRLL